jgi:hypothetical protein
MWVKMSRWMKYAADALPADYTPDDPLDMNGVLSVVNSMHRPWWEEDEQTQRQVIANAFRAALTSPRQNLQWNSIIYQHLAQVPAEETDPDVFENTIRDKRERWNTVREAMVQGVKDHPDREMAAIADHIAQKYQPGIWKNIRNCAKIGPYVEQIRQAAIKDIAEGGTGKIFRDELLGLAIPGIGPKIAAFVWLLLTPTTSDLATIDVHMMRFLGEQKDSPKSYAHYLQLEDRLRQIKDQVGVGDNNVTYPDVALGAYQWATWDKQRTPGFHQDHQPLAPMDPTPWHNVDWAPVVRVRKKSPEQDPDVGDEAVWNPDTSPDTTEETNDGNQRTISKWLKE